MSEPLFLALSALPRFWRPEGRLIFLTAGCRRFSRPEEWEGRDAGVVPDPWANPDALGAGYERVRSFCEAALPALGDRLNALHGKRQGARYWRILLGPWLTWYASVLLDRYSRLRLALDLHPGLSTIGLSPESFATPRDTFEFVNWISDDLYNVQLCSRILAALGVDFPALATAGAAPSPGETSPARANPLRSLARLLERWGQTSRSVILKDSSFPRKIELALILGSFGGVWRRGTVRTPPPEAPIDTDLRKKLGGLELGNDSFERLCSSLLPMDLPLCFVEAFTSIEAAAGSEYPSAPKAILSANGWYFDEAFKHWAGAAAESGTRLLGVPHGIYGSMRYMSLPSEEHEISIVDRYYTWGWDRPGAAKLRPMPAPKLMDPPPARTGKSRGKILFGLTSGPRFLREFPFTPEHYANYLEDQLRFARALSSEVRSNIQVRPHFADHGWDIEARWRREFPEISLVDWKTTFREALEASRVYVCDHCSTTYAESLATGHPTLLFWNPLAPANLLRPEAQDVYDDLRHAEILHDTPESAASALNAIYGRERDWWDEPGRQASVRRFCESYARTSPDSLKMWRSELSSMARENRT